MDYISLLYLIFSVGYDYSSMHEAQVKSMYELEVRSCMRDYLRLLYDSTEYLKSYFKVKPYKRNNKGNIWEMYKGNTKN